MLTALAFSLWSYIQPLPAELAHTTYSSGQTAAGWYRGFTSHEITVDNCTTRYLEKGQGPTVVLLHGVGVSKEVWLLMEPYLTGQYHLIIPDLPGHGQSCRVPDRDYRIQGFSRWLAAFTKELGLGRLHLVAHSVGATSAGWFTVEHPDQVLSLTVIAPAGIEKAPAQLQDLTPFMQELVQTGRNRLLIENTADFHRVAHMTVHQNPMPWLPWIAYRFLAWEYMRNQTFIDKAIRGVLITRQEAQDDGGKMRNMVTALQVPGQVIWGEEDQIMHIAGADIMASLRPDIPVHRLPDVGHGPMLEKPKLVAELVEKLITQQP